jgi:hypothetical protein
MKLPIEFLKINFISQSLSLSCLYLMTVVSYKSSNAVAVYRWKKQKYTRELPHFAPHSNPKFQQETPSNGTFYDVQL